MIPQAMNAMDAASSSRAAEFPGEDYDYLRRGFLVTVGSCLFRCFVLTVLWLYFFFVNGVRVHGFRNARRLRKTGYVAICNHEALRLEPEHVVDERVDVLIVVVKGVAVDLAGLGNVHDGDLVEGALVQQL